VKRRPLLAGVAASFALAGCSSSQSSGTDDPGSPGDSSGNTPGGPGPTRVLRSERGVTLQVEEYKLAQSVAIENGYDLENVDGAYYLLLRITSENQSDSSQPLAEKRELAIIAGGDEQESYSEIEQDFSTEAQPRITAPVEGEVYEHVSGSGRESTRLVGWFSPSEMRTPTSNSRGARQAERPHRRCL
jgi:hypothetical protein